MTDKLTIKQEKFAQKYVECGNASEAYRHAYNAEKMKMETINRNAHALVGDNKVATRIKNLVAEHRKQHDITIETITDELRTVLAKADLWGDLNNHRQGAMDMAKLHGLLVDKVEHGGKIRLDKKRGDIAERFAHRFTKDNHK